MGLEDLAFDDVTKQQVATYDLELRLSNIETEMYALRDEVKKLRKALKNHTLAD